MDRLRFLLIVSSLTVVASSSGAAVIIDNGLAPPNPANVVNSLIPDSLHVQNSTTVELADSGQVGDMGSERLEVFDTSTILMTGGLVWDDIFAHGTSTVTMSGGTINSGLVSFDDTTVLVTGGVVSTGVDGNGSSNVTVLGGMFGAVTGRGDSTVVIRGGQITHIGQVSGNSTLTIVGSGFLLDGAPIQYGAISPIAGQLTGTLESGDLLDAIYSRELTATVVLAPIPEPSTALLLGLGLVGMSAKRRV